MSTILPSHYSSSNNTAQSDLPGSVVAQAGGRSSNAPQEEHKPLSANNNNEASNATTKTPLVIGLVLLAVVAIGGVTVWRRSSAGSSFGGGGPSATTQTTIAQVLEGVSMPAAREWMLTEDRYSARNTLSASRIRQRYTIAAVMVASNTQPNRDASECDWEGVECEDDDVVWRLERSGGASTSTTTAAAGQQHLPDELATFLPQIRELLLTQMQFSGTIPTPAATTTGWQQLTWLELSRNALTGTVPPELWTLPNLKFLYLDENNLTGRLERLEDSTTTDTASSVVAVSSLRQVHIFANRLTGPLPTWLGELYQLEHWIAYSNQLTGPALPEGAAPPPQLTYYDMSSNQLSGRIPPLLWSTTAATSSDTNDAAAAPPPLETIYLEHNRLTGPLPPSSQRIPTLQTVYLRTILSPERSRTTLRPIGWTCGDSGWGPTPWRVPFPRRSGPIRPWNGWTCRKTNWRGPCRRARGVPVSTTCNSKTIDSRDWSRRILAQRGRNCKNCGWMGIRISRAPWDHPKATIMSVQRCGRTY